MRISRTPFTAGLAGGKYDRQQDDEEPQGQRQRLNMVSTCEREMVWRPARLCTVVSLTAVALFLLAAANGYAQQTPSQDEERVRVGGFSFTPGLVFAAGYDSNMNREVPPVAGQDVYAVPQANASWRAGSFLLNGHVAEEFVSDSHLPNSRLDGEVKYSGPLLDASVRFERPRTNARPTGFEIGKKSRRVENRLFSTIAAKPSRRTALAFTYNTVGIAYDADAIYLTSSLREKLNRHTRALMGDFTYKVTPLTQIGARAEFRHDEFQYSPQRNGDIRKIGGIVSFAPPAMVSGTASFGYVGFRSRYSGAANFTGWYGQSQVTYAGKVGVLSFSFDRDLEYSYDMSLAYYLLTSALVNFTRPIIGPWHSFAYVANHSLDYRPAGTVGSIGRREQMREAGGAIAYQISRWSRVGCSIDWYSKRGNQPFSGARTVTFVTYGKQFVRLDRPVPYDQ
jgi:hypothetical protein